MSIEDDQQANANALAHLESLGIHKPKTTSSAPVIPPRADVSTGPRVHELKVQTQFWADLWEFRTTAQLRQDDRQYRVGDILDLREYNPSFGFTGMNCKRKVTHILRHEDVPYGVRRGWCILSTAPMDTRSSEEAFRVGFEQGFSEGMSEGMPGHEPTTINDAWASYRDSVGTT